MVRFAQCAHTNPNLGLFCGFDCSGIRPKNRLNCPKTPRIAPKAVLNNAHVMRKLRHLTHRRRPSAWTQALGFVMAFNAGAVNAGGFMVLGLYTSHMTGFVSMIADHMVLGNTALVLAALGTIVAFATGAAVSAALVALADALRLRSPYALPLLLVAALMLAFGLLGAVAMRWQTPFAVPLTALVLAFTMGVQNATLTKMSRATIRTTHMTGVITDLGIELGRWWFARYFAPREGLLKNPAGQNQKIAQHRQRATLFFALLAMFLLGAVLGATGFHHLGFICVLPLALLFMAVSVPPLWLDYRRLMSRKVTNSSAVVG